MRVVDVVRERKISEISIQLFSGDGAPISLLAARFPQMADLGNAWYTESS